MNVTQGGGKASRVSWVQLGVVRVALVAFLLLAPPALAQGDYDFKISRLADAFAYPGEEWEVTAEVAHTCPATGRVRMLVQGDDQVDATSNDAVWGDCASDGYAHATATVRVHVLPNATAGLHAVAVAAFWEGHVTKPASTLKITVPFVASVTLSTPRETLVLPGRAVEVPVEVALTANSDAWVSFSTSAPASWIVEGTQATTVEVANGSGAAVRRLRFTAPTSAHGDIPISITALPLDALTHREAGRSGSTTWTARLPPKVSEDPTPRPVGPSGESPASDVEPMAPVSADREWPVWGVAVALIGAGGLAFWWTRQRT